MSLDDLTLPESFYVNVLLAGDYAGRPLPCWFAKYDPHGCKGRVPRAAHFLKRRRVEKLMDQQLPVRMGLGDMQYDEEQAELITAAAAWDPRNGVPSCESHDLRHDSLEMPPLVIPAHQVPSAVCEFALDYGLEYELERRCPPSDEQISTLECVSSERALLDG